jgi:serine/threonine protein kinase
MEVRVGGRYRLEELIKRGKISEVWKAVDVITQNQFAVKVSKNKKSSSETDREVKIYEMLRKVPGFAKVHWHGKE